MHRWASLLVDSPRRGAGDVWRLPPVWNLRAVIWFNFTISALVLLSSSVNSVFFLLPFVSAGLSILRTSFHKILQYFLVKRKFCVYGSCLVARRNRWSVVCSARIMLNWYLHNIFNFHCFCSFLFILFKSLVSINRQKNARYQRVLSLCAFLIGAIPKGLINRFFVVVFDVCVCMFCFT